MGFYRGFGKRFLDLIISIFALAVLSPVMIIIGILIRVEDKGPALFVQKRTGRFGVEFSILKFRSMAVGTESLPSGEIASPTVTQIGRFIRRTNLDELPQLVNIVKGDMSIVGPRPPLPSQVVVIEARKSNGALDLYPGLTGLAQVNSFDGMSPIEKAWFDGKYASNVTFRTDIGIILRTFNYVFSPPPKY